MPSTLPSTSASWSDDDASPCSSTGLSSSASTVVVVTPAPIATPVRHEGDRHDPPGQPEPRHRRDDRQAAREEHATDLDEPVPGQVEPVVALVPRAGRPADRADGEGQPRGLQAEAALADEEEGDVGDARVEGRR